MRAYQDAVRRRAVEREPVAYITGRRAFRNIELAVDRRALVPRPETELLVESALTLPRGGSVLDVCTGSGAVALALKQERDDLDVWGSDVSEPALALARENAARLGLEVGWLYADLLDGVPDAFDAVLANPPYVPDAERPPLAPEILRHEPASALFAGPDGLAVIEPLVRQLGARERSRRPRSRSERARPRPSRGCCGIRASTRTSFEMDLGGIKRVVIGRKGRG